jgi:hypothetical protein
MRRAPRELLEGVFRPPPPLSNFSFSNLLNKYFIDGSYPWLSDGSYPWLSDEGNQKQ